MAATWLKLVYTSGMDTITKMINTDHYTDIEPNAADPTTKTDLKCINLDVITIDVPFITVQQFLNPLLIREDQLGNAL